MKKRFIYVLLPILCMMLVVSCSTNNPKGKFSFSPQKPLQGDEITVRFNADSTKLADADSINMVAYLYSINPDNTLDIMMRKENSYWTGKFKTADSTCGILIKFVDASTEGEDNEVIANNDNKGFVIHIYDKNGNVVPGSAAGLAKAITNWGTYYLNINKNEKLAKEYYDEDFSKNPGIKDDYLDSYLALVTNKNNQDSIVNAELAPVEAKKNKGEKDLSLLVNWFGRIQDAAKENKYKEILKEKFPASDYFQMQNYRMIFNEKDLNKQSADLNKFEHNYPGSQYSPILNITVANNYIRKKEYNKAIKILQNHSTNKYSYYFYNAVKLMLNNNAPLNRALELAKEGVKRAQAEVDNPTDKKPALQSAKSWLESRQYYLAINLYGEAMVLNKMQKDKEAESLLENAIKYSKENDSDINDLYAKVLLADSEYDKLLDKVGDFIKSGKSTKDMDDILKEAYVMKNGSEAGFDKLLQKYNDSASANLEKDIRSQMINEPAPDFTLTNLDGNKVSLKDLRGKTVIVDFWATWCGPCVSSFPGMKTLLKKYQNNPDVKFLFVDTWESVKDKKENAQKFIKNNNYPFNVLLDTESKVVEKYHVSGIPTKFFIDKNGIIRFKSIGFSGNADQMNKEISAVISILNGS